MAISNKDLKARIRFATKTVSEWMVEDEIILKGEPTIAIPDGYVAGESDITLFKPIFKIGDGEHVWVDLPEVGNSSHSSLVFEKTDVNISDSDFLNTELPNAAPGTFVVVKSTLVEDNPDTEENEEKISQTAYVSKSIQDEEGNEVIVWVALEGNYSADTVYFEDDFLLAGDFDKVGNYKVNTTLEAKGKSLTDVMSSILTKELEGKITNPSCTITLVGAGSYEVGTVVNPTYTTTFDDGAYTYGPNVTGVRVTSETATLNGVEGMGGSFRSVMVSDGMNIKASLTVNYTEGVLANTNLGNQGTVRIAAGSCTASSSAIIGYRNMFYKVLENDVTLSSDVVRGWSKQRSTASELVLEANVVSNPKSVVIVTIDEIDKVLLTSAQNSDITSEFKRENDLTVNGASEGTGMTYKVYKYQPASLDRSEKYKITFK